MPGFAGSIGPGPEGEGSEGTSGIPYRPRERPGPSRVLWEAKDCGNSVLNTQCGKYRGPDRINPAEGGEREGLG